MTRSALVLALLLPLAGCGSGQDDGGDAQAELTVLAASSLTDVYQELATSFEEENDADVTFSFGSSTDLAEQAADGAPGDVLATADETSMKVAEDAGVTGDVTDFATNVMVIVTPAGNPAGIESLEDLDGATWVRCADEVPCGRVAQSVLEDNDITAQPASLEEDVRSTLDKVVSGEADAGLVYASDAVAAGNDVETIEIPGAEKELTTYFIATLEQSADSDLAEKWVDLVNSDRPSGTGPALNRQASNWALSRAPSTVGDYVNYFEMYLQKAKDATAVSRFNGPRRSVRSPATASPILFSPEALPGKPHPRSSRPRRQQRRATRGPAPHPTSATGST